MESRSISIDLKGNLRFNIATTKLNHEFIITSWNRGLKYYGKEDGVWESDEIDTGFSFISNEIIEVQDESVSLFLEQVPQEISALIKPYQYRQFTMLQIMAQSPETIDIFKQSSTLFWMVVAEGADRQWSHAKIVEVLHKKRTSIVELLIGKSCKKGVKFIEKAVLYTGDINEFDLLKKCLLNTNLIETFQHETQVLIQALAVGQKRNSFLHGAILKNEIDPNKSSFSQNFKFSYFDKMVKDIERMAERLDRTLPANYFSNYTSENALNRLHDKWITRFNAAFADLEEQDAEALQLMEERLFSKEEREKPFPVCKLGDADGFIQIKNYEALIEEGSEMNHCVGSYFEQASAGSAYFYKLLSPERATVEIKIQHNKVSVTQFKLARNKKPSRVTYDRLHELLHRRVGLSASA